nr:MAG: replication associated protein [Cressdnaviricota sp.]
MEEDKNSKSKTITDSTKSQRWLFTCNNPPKEFVLGLIWDPDEMIYMVGQREKAPTTGTEHVHAYIVFKCRKAFKTIKAWSKVHFPVEPRIDVCNGNEEQNKNYVTKADDRIAGPWEFGTYDINRGVVGHRTDLDDVFSMIKAGKTFKQIAEAHPSDAIRYTSNIQNTMMSIQELPPVQRDVKVVTLWGVTGVGKTHRIMMRYPDIYQVIPGRDPWGNYQGETEILFDEFEEDKWTIQQMNRFLDKWRCKLDSRYHDRYARWTTVFICANSDPQGWYIREKNGMIIQSLQRRLGLIPGGNGTVVEVTSKEQEIPQLVPIAIAQTSTSPPQQVPIIAPIVEKTSTTDILNSPSPQPPLKRHNAQHIITDDMDEDKQTQLAASTLTNICKNITKH